MRNKYQSLRTMYSILALAMAISGCSAAPQGTTTGNPITYSEDTSASGAVAGAVGGALSSSSTTGTFGFYNLHQRSNFFGQLINSLFLPKALAGGLCPTYRTNTPSKCTASGGTLWLTLNNCAYSGESAFWNGVETLTSSSGSATCGTFPTPGASGFIERQYVTVAGSTTPSTATLNTFSGINSTVDDQSSNLSNFDNATIATIANGGYGTRVNFNSNGARNQVIIARRVVASGDFDHSISGTITVNEAVGASSRTLTGSVQIYHNLLRVIGAATFNNVVHDDTCCLPISGSISTVFSAGTVSPTTLGQYAVNKTETLTFTACGRAVLQTYDGVTENVELNRCF